MMPGTRWKPSRKHYYPLSGWVLLSIVIWCIAGSTALSNLVMKPVQLWYTYGFTRVQREGLHFIKTPKNGDWIVSNGDVLDGHQQSSLNLIPTFLVTAVGMVLLAMLNQRLQHQRLERRHLERKARS